jgi:hypothetical protein
MLFELSVIAITVIFLLLLFKIDKNTLKHFFFAFIAVLLFEYFTQALWFNKSLEPWTYLYLDISWIITIGWAIIIVVGMKLVELYFPTMREKKRFFLYLIFITLAGLVAESVVLKQGIREYSSATLRIMSGVKIGNVPIEALYYIPVFMTLVISFMKYMEMIFEKKAKKATK